MDWYFSYVTTIISAVIFGLEFLACIFVGARRGFDFPTLYLAVACAFGIIAYAIPSAVASGTLVDYHFFPGYYYAIIIFNYFQILMMVFLPVSAISLLIRKRNQHNDGNHSQTPMAVKGMVYFGYLVGVAGLILMFASLGLAGSYANGSANVMTYSNVSIACFMILWFFFLFWIVIVPFHRSIHLQHLGSFIGYGVLITLPILIQTIVTAEPRASVFFNPGLYASFALFNIPLYFAVIVALVYGHRWIIPDIQSSPESV